MSGGSEETSAVEATLGDAKSIGDAVRQTAEQMREVGANALDQAHQAAEEAQSRVSSIATELGDRATAAAETQKDSLADQLDGLAKVVHKSGEQLEGQQEWLAGLVERGAEELSSLANTLRSNDLQGLLGSLGGLARRQPALFAGASMAVGFALSRIGRVAVATAPKAAPETGTAAPPSSAPAAGVNAGSGATP